MATTLSYHVAGPIVPQANIGGAGAYVNLGVCEEGADIDIQIAQHDIKHDGGGGLDGFETNNIFLNAVANVRFTLVPFAGDYVNTLRAKAHAGSTQGTMVIPGTLFGENSMYVSIYLPASATGEVDGPWRFPSCRVMVPGSNRVSTKETKPRFEFRAINYFAIASATSIVGVTTWLRTAPP